MRITVERRGRVEEVEVSADLTSATLAGRTFPVRVVSETPDRVELEVAGEVVVVEHWTRLYPEPPGPVDVNGERYSVGVLRGPGTVARTAVPREAGPPGASATAAAAPAGPSGAVPVVPPLPGRVIEVRVREGEKVEKGQVLLLLEAMKMRNEIASPAAGVVRDIRVSPGTNARSREAMMFIAPAS